MTLHRAVGTAAAFILFATACSSSNDGPGTTDQDSAIDDAIAETGADAGGDASPETSTDAADTKDGAEATDTSDASGIVDGADAEDARDAAPDVAGDASDASDGACKPGSIESEACGKCGMRSRLCAEDGGGWLPWGDCASETGECVPKDTRTVPCGRCGTRAQSCDDTCTWISALCTGEGECTAGDSETQYDVCGDPSLVKVRTCSDTCSWSAWSDCEALP